MADYYAVLKRTLSGLPENTGEARRGVYEKARAALVRQLQGFDPALPPSEITRQRLALEESIRKVEAEAARESLGLKPMMGVPEGGQPPARTRLDPPSPRPAPPQPARPRRPETPPRQRPIFQSTPGQPRSPSLAPASAPPRRSGQSPFDRPVREPTVAKRDVFRQAIAEAEALGGTASPQGAPVAEEDFMFEEPSFREEFRQNLTDAEDAVDFDDEPDMVARRPQDLDTLAGEREPGPAPSSTRLQPVLPRLGPVLEAEGRLSSGPPVDYRDRFGESRSTRYMTYVGIAAAALLVVGVGAFAYSQRDMLTSFLNEPETADPAPQAPPAPETKIGTAKPKSEDRLLSDSPQPKVRTVRTTRVIPTTPNSDQPASTQTERTVRQVGAPRAEKAPTVDVTPQTQTAATQRPTSPGTATAPARTSPAVPLAAQRAVLREDAGQNGEPGRVVTGAVRWQVIDEVDSAGGTPTQVLQARSEFTELNIAVVVSIRKNNDSALPASHLVEIQFELPDDFKGKGISNVPALNMKTTEESRGDPLIGASARVARGMYWIALSSRPQDIKRNEDLLRDRGWIDIPVLYESGQRATLTLEKGAAGEQTVEQAMTAWAGATQ